MRKNLRSNLIWIDLEMTGLDPDNDTILEIATIVTNNELEVLAEGPDIVIHQPDSTLESMNDWCKVQHRKSGLYKAVQESTISMEEAENKTLEFLALYFKPDQGVLCGNSVWNDKMFMRHHMRILYNFMNYRIIDVSSVKEILVRWYPTNPYTDFKKNDSHRAMGDIKESIEELKHYRQYFFIPESITQPAEK